MSLRMESRSRGADSRIMGARLMIDHGYTCVCVCVCVWVHDYRIRLPLEDRPHARELVVEELAHVAWQVGGLSVVVEHEVDDLSTRCALHAAFARCKLL